MITHKPGDNPTPPTLKPGDAIYVANPNIRKVHPAVAKEVLPHKVVFETPDEGGYIGARLGICFLTEAEAVASLALQLEELDRP